MPPGRRPKPTSLKLLEGNRGKKRLPTHEPKPDPTMPTPPAGLGAIDLDEWHYLAPELHRLGVLTLVDRAALAAYCDSYEQWVKARDVLAVEGMLVESPNGYRIPHPANTIANQAKGMMHKYLIEFGLTAASRAKLARGEVRPDDPFEAWNKPAKKWKR